MQIFNIFTLLMILSAAFSYINTRYTKLPTTIAFMLGSLVLSLGLLFLKRLQVTYALEAIAVFNKIDFGATVLYGILSFILFAGALQLDFDEIAREKWVILTLATISVIISTFVVGTLMWGAFTALGVKIPYLYALGFGALISPTDPVVVVPMIRDSKMPHSLKMKIMGESLFNDGISIVLFVVIFSLATFGGKLSFGGVSLLLLKQVVGSIVLGGVLGWFTYRLVNTSLSPTTQIFLTLGFVAGGYDLALLWGTSGPITVVIMGLFVRNWKGKDKCDSTDLYRFWSLLDEFLNAALFVMIGLEILKLPFSWAYISIGLIAIVATLLGRFVSVVIPIRLFGMFRTFARRAVTCLTWGGLRGGISLALALSLPTSLFNNAILTATYMIVLFSVVVQGLTFKKILAS